MRQRGKRGKTFHPTPQEPLWSKSNQPWQADVKVTCKVKDNHLIPAVGNSVSMKTEAECNKDSDKNDKGLAMLCNTAAELTDMTKKRHSLRKKAVLLIRQHSVLESIRCVPNNLDISVPCVKKNKQD